MLFVLNLITQFSGHSFSFCFRQREKYRQLYLPWALSTSKKMKPLITVYWEKRWDQDIDELRQELNIEPLDFDRILK